MGFINREANIQGKSNLNLFNFSRFYILLYFIVTALLATFGDVNAAIDRLLQQR